MILKNIYLLTGFILSLVLLTDVKGQDCSCDSLVGDMKSLRQTIETLKSEKKYKELDSLFALNLTKSAECCPCSYKLAKILFYDAAVNKFSNLKKRNEAFNLYETLINRCQSVNDSTTLLMHSRKARHHLFNDEFLKMKYHCEQAIAIGEKFFQPNYPDLFAVKINYGLYHHWLREYHKALEIHLKNEAEIEFLPMTDTLNHIINIEWILRNANQTEDTICFNNYKTKLQTLVKNTRFQKNVEDNLNELSFSQSVIKKDTSTAAIYLATLKINEDKPGTTEFEILYISYLIMTGKIKKAAGRTAMLEKELQDQNLPSYQFFRINLSLQKLKMAILSGDENERKKESLFLSRALYNNYLNLFNVLPDEQSSRINLLQSKFNVAMELLAKNHKTEDLLVLYDRMNNLKNASSAYYKIRQKLAAESGDPELKSLMKTYLNYSDSLLKITNLDNEDRIIKTLRNTESSIQAKMSKKGITWTTNNDNDLIRSQLGKDEIFVDFYQLNEESSTMVAFVLSDTDATCIVYDSVQVKKFWLQGRSNYINNKNKNQSLYDFLIKPLEPYFLRKTKIFISTNGLTDHLAFEILSPIGSMSNIMADSHEIIYVENSAELTNFKSSYQVATHPRKIVLAGAIKYDCGQKSNQNSEKTLPTYLKGSVDEVESIAFLAGNHNIESIILKGCDASKSKLLTAIEDEKTDIIHISTHGFVRENGLKEDENNGFFNSNHNTSVQLAPDRDKDDQGMLTSLEVLATNMTNKNLVFLSACNTGRGSYLPSIGTTSVANSFKKAGAKKVISTLWAIPDEITAEFCRSFYSYYFTTGDVHKALMEAKNKLRRQGLSPEKWAAFRILN